MSINMSNFDKMSQMLEAYDVPAILVTVDYEIIASNKIYEAKFGSIDFTSKPNCYAVSHGYSTPCDQAGEDCPLLAAKESKHKEKVLHIHQTPNGREHVDVEMIPIFDSSGDLSFFVELLKPIPLASGKAINQKMVGASLTFSKMLKSITHVAKSDVNVLLLGETGTGKELVSQAIHMGSLRKNKPLVTLECAGLSESLIESELFGHRKGAFTGANANKIGLVQHADGGTLFLDEIGDVSLATQVKLLRLIESKTFRRVGGTEVRTSDFRLICATHKNLTELIEQGQFRLDLYYRINVFPINVPSLRERTSDIPLLVDHLLRQESSKLHITESAMNILKSHEFKGNIRELRNLISRASVICETSKIDEKIIRDCINFDKPINQNQQTQPQNINTSLKELERKYIIKLSEKHANNKTKMAEEAEISIRTLYRKIESSRSIN